MAVFVLLKRLAPLSLFLFSLMFLSSCSDSSLKRDGQTLHLSIIGDPPTLDPRKANDSSSINIISFCHEGLFSLDENGKAQFALAEGYRVSEDQKVYTISLRSSRWSDGSPITADNFARSWKEILSPSFASEKAATLFVIKNGRKAKMGECSTEEVGVSALDAKTLQITLEHPSPFFLTLLSTSPFYPTPEPFNQYLASGPFQIEKWEHNREIRLKKNEAYWDQQSVQLHTIRLFSIADEATALSMYERDELDWLGYPFSSIGSDAVQYLSDNPDFHTRPLPGTYFYSFNTKIFPFSNLNLRKAMALAINRQMIVDHITQTNQIPATAFVPAALWGENYSYFTDNSEAEAQQLFREALQELHLTVETFPATTLCYNQEASGHHKIAQAIQQQWLQVLGIRVQLESIEWKVFLDRYANGKFQIARTGWIGEDPDPAHFLDYFQQIRSTWSDKRFLSLMKKAKFSASFSERTNYLVQAESRLLEEMAVIPIYFYTANFLKKPYLHGCKFTSLGNPDFKTVYLSHHE